MIRRAGVFFAGPTPLSCAGVLHHFFTDVNMALKNIANCAGDFVWILPVNNVAVPASPKNPGGENRLIAHGGDQQFEGAIYRSKHFNQFQSAFPRHSDIHQDEFRPGLNDGRESLIDGSCRAAHHQVPLAVQNLHQPPARIWMVLHHKYPPICWLRFALQSCFHGRSKLCHA